MKKFISLLLCLLVFSCSAPRRITETTSDEIVFGASMVNRTYVFTIQQVDSVCRVDGLPRNLNQWNVFDFADYETGEIIQKCVYYKGNIVYTVIPLSEKDKFKLEKRITKK